MKSLLRMFRFLRRYPRRLLAFVLISGIYALFHMSFALVAKVVTRLLEDKPVEWLPPDPLRRQLLYVVLIAEGLLLGKCLFQYARRYLQSWLSKRIVVDTQNDVAAHLLTLDLGYYQRVRQGELMSRMTNDMRMLAQTATLFCQLVSQPLVLAVGVGYVLWLNWRLAFLALVAAPFAIGVLRSLSRKMRRASKRTFEKQADATGVFLQFISGIKVVKSFGCETHERSRFAGEMQTVFNVGMKGARARARVRPVVEFMSGQGLLLVFYVGGVWVLDDKIHFDELMSFVAALGLMYSPAKEVSQANSQAQETLPAAERVFDIFDTEPEIRDRPDARPLTAFRDRLRLEHVTFSYTPHNPVLHKVCLEVPAGSRIALVGPSGAGKSTLVDLVARFHDPQEGRITVDGTDLRDITLDSLLSHIAIVSQDAFLFHDTVRGNIAYGRPGADEAAIEAAARAAAIHEEILALPEGYETVVGERGGRLSGGQRQRLCIARALLKDAPILILDEATSSLDTENERLVQAALETLMEDRTSLVIAHRLSTIRHADRVVVLEEGRITAQGTHDELLEAGGTYAHLWSMQAGPAPDRRQPPPAGEAT